MDDSGTFMDAPYPPVAGRCRLCGHALPYAYSLTSCTALPSPEQPEGEFARQEFTADSPQAKHFETMGVPGVRIGAGMVMLWPKSSRPTKIETVRDVPTVVASAAMNCQSVTTAVFDAASRVRREKATQKRLQGQTREMAQEMAQKQNARRAAAALSSSLARQQKSETPAPTGEAHF